MNNLSREIIRGQFVGLLVGAAGGAVLAVGSSSGPIWHADMIPVAVFGMLMGGALGALGGFAAGMTLRSMRNVHVGWAATTVALVVAAVVAVTLSLLGWTSASNPWDFPFLVGVLAGVSAAVASPWIRRPPTAVSN